MHFEQRVGSGRATVGKSKVQAKVTCPPPSCRQPSCLQRQGALAQLSKHRHACTRERTLESAGPQKKRAVAGRPAIKFASRSHLAHEQPTHLGTYRQETGLAQSPWTACTHPLAFPGRPHTWKTQRQCPPHSVPRTALPPHAGPYETWSAPSLCRRHRQRYCRAARRKQAGANSEWQERSARSFWHLLCRVWPGLTN